MTRREDLCSHLFALLCDLLVLDMVTYVIYLSVIRGVVLLVEVSASYFDHPSALSPTWNVGFGNPEGGIIL